MFLKRRQGIWLATTGPSRKLWWLGDKMNGPFLGSLSLPLTLRPKKRRTINATTLPERNQRNVNRRLLFSAARTLGSSGSTARTASQPGVEARAEVVAPPPWRA